MRLRKGWVGGALLALAVLAGGCQQAGRYGATSARSTEAVAAKGADKDKTADKDKDKGKKPEADLTPVDVAWEKPVPSLMETPISIQFVHEGTHRDEWGKLKAFWNGPSPADLAAISLLPALAQAAALAKADNTVRIKVPLGLDDPTPHIPAANHPTVGKWELGRQLFHDESYLDPRLKVSCASCHRPDRAFSDVSFAPGRPDVPTLINVVYSPHLFWDGRASSLEEVVQLRAEDEKPAANVAQRFHSWGGVVGRLRKNKDYDGRFEKVFGTRATQDAVGKALATFMRTFLLADALHDRAEHARRARKANAVEPADYEKLLDKDALKRLGKDPDKDKPADVAKDLHAGYTLFRGAGRCVQCHSGPTFTDNGFHNLGVGDSGREPIPGEESGRFAALPPGLKDKRMIGAYKTPTLRALMRTQPYFHDGFMSDLTDVVEFHNQGGRPNPHLDPELRKVELKDTEVAALVLFLRALEGGPVEAVIATPPK